MSHTSKGEDTDSFAVESSDSELSVYLETTHKHNSSKNTDIKKEGDIFERNISDDTLSSSKASGESYVYQLVDEKSKNALLKLLEGRSTSSKDSHADDASDNYSIDSVQNMVNEFLTSEHGDKTSFRGEQSFTSPSREVLDSRVKDITPSNKVSMWLGNQGYSGGEYESDFETSDSEINKFEINEEFDKISGTSATEDTEENFSARLIQSRYRGHRTRLSVAPQLSHRKSAAIKMQSSFRRYHDRSRYKAHIEARKMSKERERKAAELHQQTIASVKIQKTYRGHIGKKIYAATRLQKLYRGHAARKNTSRASLTQERKEMQDYSLQPEEVLQDEQIRYVNTNELEEKSDDDFDTLDNIDNFLSDLSKSLESLDDIPYKENSEEYAQNCDPIIDKPNRTRIKDEAAVHRNMRLQQQLKLNLEKNNKIMYVKKAIVIQKYVRRYIVISGSILRKKKTERRQKRLEQLQKKKSMASIRIQGYIRGYLVRRREELKNRRARREKQQRQQEFERRQNASVLLQAQYRMHRSKREYVSMKRQLQVVACTRIQACTRGHQVRQKDIINLKKTQHNSATRIQKLYRGRSVRTSEDLRLRKESRENHKRKVAVIKIQSRVRVHHAKVIAKKRVSYITLVQSLTRSFLFQRRFLIRKRKIILVQSTIRAYFGKKEGRKRSQIRDFERAKRAKRIEHLRHQFFIKKVMLEKKRQAELRQKSDQRRSSLRNDIQRPAIGHKKLKTKQSPIATYTNFITRPTTEQRNFKSRQNRKKNSVHRLAEHTMAFSPRNTSNTGTSMRRLNVASKQNVIISPPLKRRENYSPRTIKLYRLYSHDYDIR